MRGPRKANAENWEFDGKTITVRIPMTFARRGGRKVIVAPDGGDAWAPAQATPGRDADPRAGAGASVEAAAGTRKSTGPSRELAEAEGLTRSFVNRLLRLTLLAPEIIEAILNGLQPKEMQLEDLTRALPSAWDEQWQCLFAKYGPDSRQRTPPRIN